MEKIINDFSIGLFLWQTILLILLILIIYCMIKLYSKVVKYMENKVKNNRS